MVTSCPTCGGELSRDSSVEGLCPGCLVNLAVEAEPGLDVETANRFDYIGPASGEVAAELESGQVLGGRYRIHRLLGHGGMGEVWWAVDLKLRVEVALKALRPELLGDDEALRALRAEVRMARQVASANVCRVFDLVEAEGRELLSMELVNGVTLHRVLEERGPLDLSEARRVAAQLLAGLGAIHQAGLVHRDVKPENVMVTSSGRVVLMDFGIARSLIDRIDSRVSGTPAFMAPEQRRGEAPIAASDVFSAGVVLAEMVAPGGAADLEARWAVWDGIHRSSPEVADTPWRPVILRAVAGDPEARFSSASELARALDEVTLRSDVADQARPYPGLAAFSQEDAGFFFGRELEVEELWRKLTRPHLMGLIGPSGAGKSSFLRAGLLPAAPPGWRAVVTIPGQRPLANLVRQLKPELSDDTAVTPQLIRADEASVLEAVRSWRRRHDHVLVVVDQFEELFTLNPPEVQERVSRLLSCLVVEADAHVLLSMRDDFLFRCADQPALAPVFSELTPLSALPEAALRRALVQPALTCGYRFDDEDLVDEMVSEVGGERGALPLLAFAASRLWELRDREHGRLTRDAYERVGGVGGALARHAEATLGRIGPDGVSVVRELLRNLVTPEGTRATRSRDELLSVFGPAGEPAGSTTAGRTAAERVLDVLVDARLLTTYEVPCDDDGDSPRQMVEIIHESLLTAWPRLVHWQAQDQEGALLRDQLRQAARTWDERGRPDDLLWTGTSYRELLLWRERYSGRLSATEETFARVMVAHAGRRRRRRRLAVGTVFVILLGVLGVVGRFWRQAETARTRAQLETRRGEASQLLALGRLQLESDPTAALAYALASLERDDRLATRLLAAEVLSRGPTAFYLGKGTPAQHVPAFNVSFSPDGRWLAAGGPDDRVHVWARSGGEPKVIETPRDRRAIAEFAPVNDVLVTRSFPSHVVQVWSVREPRLIRTLPGDGAVDFRVADDPPRVVTFRRVGDLTRVESWPLDGTDRVVHGEIAGNLHGWSKYPNPWNIEVDTAGLRLVYAPPARSRDDGSTNVRTVELEALGREPARVVGERLHVGGLRVHPDGRHVAVADFAGHVRMWSLAGPPVIAQRFFPPETEGLVRCLRFDASGSKMAAASFSGFASVWDLEGPPDAAPLLTARNQVAAELSLHPEGAWLATSGNAAAVWPVARRYPLDLHGHTGEVGDVAFLPDGRRLLSVAQDGTMRVWPLVGSHGVTNRVLFESRQWLDAIAVDPAGRRALTASVGGEVWLVPLGGGEARLLHDFGSRVVRLALGSRIAVAHGGPDAPTAPVLLWDLATGRQRRLDAGRGVRQVLITHDERLVTVAESGIRLWNLDDGSVELLADTGWRASLSYDRRRLLADRQGADAVSVLYDLDGGEATVLEAHGSSAWGELDATGRVAATLPLDGGPYLLGAVEGGPVHPLFHPETIKRHVLSPDARWLAVLAGSGSTTIRLLPVPDLSSTPLTEQSHDELLATLGRLTNLRVVPEPESSSGWSRVLEPFPGWEEVPEW